VIRLLDLPSFYRTNTSLPENSFYFPTSPQFHAHNRLAMAVPRNSVRGFLSHAKSALYSAIESNQKITLVIGNESAGELIMQQY
jgi:hypothetical protein